MTFILDLLVSILFVIVMISIVILSHVINKDHPSGKEPAEPANKPNNDF
jgi:hypothetical protein